MPRLLAVSPVAHPGGAENALLRFLRRLDPARWTIELTTPGPGPLDHEPWPVHTLDLGGLGRGEGAKAVLSFPKARKLAAATRYPQPRWEPNGGWKVDPALVFAHTLQESRFQRTVVSPAGAYGLMQVRPGTAKDLARWRGESVNPADLRIPAVNMDFGQS